MKPSQLKDSSVRDAMETPAIIRIIRSVTAAMIQKKRQREDGGSSTEGAAGSSQAQRREKALPMTTGARESQSERGNCCPRMN